MAPAVSIVMPAFDAATTIGAAVAGVLWQDDVDLELVVVDDGSTDGTSAVVDAIGDPRIVLLRQENRGPAVARNAGMAVSTAPLIALCDADDILLPTHLSSMITVHREYGGIVTANAWLLRADGIITKRRLRHRGRFPVVEDQRLAILQENFVSTMSLFPRSLAERLGGFDETLRLAEDWDFWIRAVLEGARVNNQPHPRAIYSRMRTSLSSDEESMARATRTVLEKVSARGDLRPDEQAYLATRLDSDSPAEHIRAARDALAAGRWHAAASSYRAATRLSPHNGPLRAQALAMRIAPRLAGPLLRRRS